MGTKSGLRDQRSSWRTLLSVPIQEGAATIVYICSAPTESDHYGPCGLKREDADGEPLYYRIATGRPYRGYGARLAAEQLLIKAWQAERDELDKSGYGPLYHLEVFEPGLLTHLPRERIIVPGPTACACCGSTKLGEDVTETLEVVTTPGAYEYFCSLHPHMTGAIVVEAATGSKAAQ